MAYMRDVIRKAVQAAEKALGRKPAIKVFTHDFVGGTVLEDHEDGLVLGDCTRERHGVQPDGQLQVMRLPVSEFSSRVYWYYERPVYVVVEEVVSPIVRPEKKLVLP